MLTMLLAYDAAGNVVATLDHLVARDDNGNVTGLIDFEAHETAGGKLRDIWSVDTAVGSGTWPEWIGARAHDFRVERGPDGKIAALVHKQSGHRREKGSIARFVQSVSPDEQGSRDIRHLVGGPGRPLVLDDQGRTVGRSPATGTPAHLPLIATP